jgi:hypothetical protein
MNQYQVNVVLKIANLEKKPIQNATMAMDNTLPTKAFNTYVQKEIL